jgi:hypothetical protein
VVMNISSRLLMTIQGMVIFTYALEV